MRAFSESAVSQSDGTAFRDERSTAVYLGISVQTLRTWRQQNRGPRYRKIGGRCVRYSIADLAAFIEAQPAGGGQASV
jgi:predicted DNA-binding transcriptional regulator AlpA